MARQTLTDEELIELYLAQPESPRCCEWINQLFERHYVRVATWCLRFTGNREDAADLAQEIFLKVYQRLDSFRGDSKFSTWLYSIVRNHCLNFVDRCSKRPEKFSDELIRDVSDDSSVQLLEQIERNSLKRLASRLLNRELTNTERKVMFLHYGEEIPLGTISRLLALDNPSGAKAYLVSAKRKLKRAVERSRARVREGVGPSDRRKANVS